MCGQEKVPPTHSLHKVFACLAALIVFSLAGCDRNAVRERVETIREHNAKLDQVSKIRVTQEVRKHWFIDGDTWFGKLPDGSLIRLDSPVVTVLPVKAGKAFCCNWLGEATVTANRWQSHPASSSPEPFVLKYQALLESASHYTLTVSAGEDVTPLAVKEISSFTKNQVPR